MEACPTAPLPNKLSELLMVSVLDAIKTSETPGYVMNMGQWHSAGGTKCHVCMAGSVMVQRLGTDKKKTYFPDLTFGRENSFKLQAVNAMRMGYTYDAAKLMHASATGDIPLDATGLTDAQRAALDEAAELIKNDYGKQEANDLGRACWGTYRKAAEILAKAGL